MIGMPALTKIAEERFCVPRHRRRRPRVDRVGMPVVDVAAGKWRTRPLRAQRIARGVARAAMCQPFDQIGAAIPFRALRGIRPVSLAPKEQKLPASNDKALV